MSRPHDRGTFPTSGAPIFPDRYVIDPANPNNIIDMRHFTVIGPKGNAFGLGVEIMQGLMSLKDPAFSESAFDIQDFYSNNLGSQFFNGGNFKQNQPFAPQLDQFFQNRLPAPSGASNASGSFGFGNAAGGGFLLYPNKANINMMQSVYAK